MDLPRIQALVWRHLVAAVCSGLNSKGERVLGLFVGTSKADAYSRIPLNGALVLAFLKKVSLPTP